MLQRGWRLLLLSFVQALAMLVPLEAQVIIIDNRPNVPLARSYEVRQVTLDARVRDQVAEVQVSQTFHNPGSFVLEAEYLFPIPEDAGIENMVLMADGKELPGKLLSKEEARRIYEEIVRRKKDPALLEYMGRGLYRTSVFPIPPGEDRTVTLRYTQILKKDGDLVELSYPFGTQKFTAKPIEKLELNARIESGTPIKSIYSPSDEVEIKRSGENEATVKLVQRDVIPTADFRLVYALQEGDVGATVLSYRPSEGDDGYFLLLASPRVKAAKEEKPAAKTVVFVLDRSGSMSGKKIEQAREALTFVLDNLRDDDLFNIVVYDDRVETFKPELQRYGKENRAEAQRYVANIRPGGSTNIDAALRQSLEMIQDATRPNYLIFLTDGLPTAGETRETAIAENAAKANEHKARIFTFGVGYDVNARLLDRVSGQNRGTTEYVKPDEDLEAKVARFFSRLTSPVLAELSIEIKGTDVNRTYPRELPDLFEGGQLVWVGRYTESGEGKVKISGKVGEEKRSFEHEVKLAGAGKGSRNEYVARLWAVRRIGYILDRIDLDGQNSELIDELVSLSKKYGILTPYTSFLADENTDLNDLSRNRVRAGESLEALSLESGVRGVGQRANKQYYSGADRAGVAGMPGFRAQSSPLPAAPADAAYGAPGGAGGPPVVAGRPVLRQAPERRLSELELKRAPMAGAVVVSQDLEGQSQVVETVRTVGSKTLYRRGNVWIDQEVTPEEEKKAKVIRQFTDEYFTLAATQAPEQNQFLTFKEILVVRLGDQVYRIEPPAEGTK